MLIYCFSFAQLSGDVECINPTDISTKKFKSSKILFSNLETIKVPNYKNNL